MGVGRLDRFQESAATTTAARVVCVAAPGSGKTATLMARIAWLVREQHVSPSRIQAVTFTRYAAANMRDRLPEDCVGVNISTLHAFCLKVLIQHGAALGYDPAWLSIISDEDAKLDEREILSDLGLIKKQPGGKWDWRKVKAKTWYGFRDGIVNGSLSTDEAKAMSSDLWSAWQALLSRFKAQNVLTYGTILFEALNLLRTDRKALKFYRDQYRHWLVDEFQDTSHVQWSVVQRLIESANPASVFVSGDILQSIYRWRAASPDIMRECAETYEVRYLPNCYRFGKPIADAANNLASYADEPLAQTIIPRGGPSEVRVLEDQSLADTAGLVADLSVQHGAQNVAVLCRKHGPLDMLKAELDGFRVPAVKIGRLTALRESAEFRAALGYLRLAANPFDNMAFMAITASEGLTEGAILALREQAMLTGEPLVRCYGGDLPKSMADLLFYLPERDPHGDYLEALAYLQTFAYREACKDARDIVTALGLASVQDEMADAHTEVVLSTVHGFKGCERDVVLVVCMNDDVFPSPMSVKEGNEAEELNVCYVAITRARKQLYVVHNRIERGNQRMFRGVVGGPSPFIRMMQEPKEEDRDADQKGEA